MKIAGIIAFVLLPLVLSAQQQEFNLEVERVRPLRNQPGTLHIDAQEIIFRSTDAKTTVVIKMRDLREASVADLRALRFEAYDVDKWKPIERRGYTFRAQADAPIDSLAEFLAAKVRRPVVGHYWQGAQFEAPAYHRRTFGGSNGTLRIGEESIQYLSDQPADSRTWLYRDIETMGWPDSFRLRVTTNRETYVVELKGELPTEAYELAWGKVYNVERSGK